MVMGINLNDRNIQIGLGVTTAALGAAFVATRGCSEQKGVSLDKGSITSCQEASPKKSIFTFLYDKVIGSRKVESSLSLDPIEELVPVEINSEPVQVGKTTRKSFLGSVVGLFKAIFLLPFIIVASIFKGVFTGVSSLFRNKA
jgi:hypothetical protein